jgi:hypothetical protein
LLSFLNVPQFHFAYICLTAKTRQLWGHSGLSSWPEHDQADHFSPRKSLIQAPAPLQTYPRSTGWASPWCSYLLF